MLSFTHPYCNKIKMQQAIIFHFSNEKEKFNLRKLGTRKDPFRICMATCPAKSDHGTLWEVSELIHSSKSEATQKQLGLINAISWNHPLKLLCTCVWSLMYGQADVFMRSKELKIIHMPYVLAFCHWHKPTIKATWGEMSGSRLTTLRSHSITKGSQDRTQGREWEEDCLLVCSVFLIHSRTRVSTTRNGLALLQPSIKKRSNTV